MKDVLKNIIASIYMDSLILRPNDPEVPTTTVEAVEPTVLDCHLRQSKTHFDTYFDCQYRLPKTPRLLSRQSDEFLVGTSE